MLNQLATALATITLVVLFITFNVRVTLFIIIVVLLVIVYMGATIHFWGLTLNPITGMNLIFALGISIDYSVHIAHKYLVVETTKLHKTRSQKRNFKALKAISQMGTSVFHGAFSTLIVVMILGFG